MKVTKHPRLTKRLSESRILVNLPGGPLLKVLLALGETVVHGGSVSRPLEYYKALANQASPVVPLSEMHVLPNMKIFQIVSSRVKKLTLAMALCPEGVRSDTGETTYIVLLFSTPERRVPSYLALLAETVRILAPRSHREYLLGSDSASKALARLSKLELDPGQAGSPWIP